MSDLDLEAIKARCGISSRGPGDAKAFIAHAREDVPALVAEVERLREALRKLDGVHSAAGMALTNLHNALAGSNREVADWACVQALGRCLAVAEKITHDALAPRPARYRSEASEPRCGLCGYDQHVAHHLSGAAKGYHPFVSHDRG